MNINFLQGASLLGNNANTGLNAIPGMGALGAAFAGVFVLIVIVALAIYFYLAVAYSKIGKKAGQQNTGIAWVFTPIVSIFEISKMHYWPWPFLVVGYLLGYLVMMAGIATGSLASMGIFAVLGIIIIVITMIVFGIMAIIWQWKTFEAVGKPGWWAIISPVLAILGYLLILAGLLIPLLVILGVLLLLVAGIIYLVLVGLAAWKD